MRAATLAVGTGALAGCAVGLVLGAHESIAHADLRHGATLLALGRLLPRVWEAALTGGVLGLVVLRPWSAFARRLPLLPALGGAAIAAFAFAAWLALPSASQRRAEGRRSVILVSLDTLRADRVGPPGSPSSLTPRLDAFAREGAVFEEAIAAAPWTLPSHATIFTGRLPFDHGVRWSGSRLQDRRATIAEHFQNAGYATAAFTGDAYVSAEYGFEQGFDRFDERDEMRRGGLRAIADGALAWARAQRGRPFFLFVHTYEPHLPYLGVEHADPRDRGRLPETFGEAEQARVQSGALELGPAERNYVRGLYDGDVARADAAIGGMLEAMRSEGLLDDAVVVILSDHGEDLWDGPEGRSPDHGHSLRRCLVHVPWIVRAPGRVPAGRYHTPVSLVDVAPTLLGLAELPPDAEHLGHDLSGALRSGREPVPESVYAESVEYGPDRFLLREGRYAVILTPDPTETYGEVRLHVPPLEAFDVVADPLERVDLAANPTPEVRRLALRLAERVAEKKHARRGPDSPPPPALRETLKSLGYLR